MIQPVFWGILFLAMGLVGEPWWGCLPTGGAGVEPPTSRPATSPTSQASEGWWRDAVFYQIFLRSFRDSDRDGVGDFEGLIRQLDYLNDGNPNTTDDLGVKGIWLLPVFDSPSYHGYDATDYRKIKPEYGDQATFQRFLAEAHRRGIKVILDLVVNHTSSQHPWFVDSAKGASSPYRDWYVWRSENPGWTQPWGSGAVWHARGGAYYYGVFWQGMPDVNLQHPPAKKEMDDIAAYWLKMGVDGYRLDAARYIVANGAGQLQSDQPETLDYWRGFRKHTKAISKDTLLVGEIWSDARSIAKYCAGDQMDLAFHFPLAEAIFLTVTGMSDKALWQAIGGSQGYPEGCWSPFLSNHDQIRIMTRLRERMPMMRKAAQILLTMPGTPFLYYGEEIGMRNGAGQRDESKRTPMAWSAAPHGGFTQGTPWEPLTPFAEANVTTQSKDPASLLSLYRRLIHLRNQERALRRGTIQKADVSGEDSEEILAFTREDGQERVMVILNLSDNPHKDRTIQLAKPIQSRPSVLFSEGSPQLLGEAATQPTSLSSLRVDLPPYSALILKLP